ncbi:hypothetical protein D1872_246760 [compost metagenome]
MADNGDGMNLERQDADAADEPLPAPKRKRQLFSGIGIRNVDERIKYLYGEDYGVDIVSKPGEGTTVTIALPFIKS